MSILHICHIISGLDDGGAEAVLYRLCRNDNRHRHTVISMRDAGKYGPLLNAAGVTVRCLEMPRGRVTIVSLLRLWRLLRGRERPDLVQTWMYHADLLGGMFAYFARIRCVCWGIHHTSLEPDKSKSTTILIAKLCAWLSKWVPQKIICCAHKAADAHAALGYDASKLVIIPNGYELAVFQPNPTARERLRAEWNLSDSLPLIGMVGRFHPMKDHAGLIAALERVAAAGMDFHCLLVGAGMEETNPALKDSIDSAGLGDRVHLLGRRDDIPSVMCALDIHVLSSFGEAFPNVLAEAMACGTPCVTTDVGDAAMIVGETGWVTSPGQPEALAGAIIQALQARHNQTTWDERCAAARARIQENFSVEMMAQRYSQIWEDTCA